MMPYSNTLSAEPAALHQTYGKRFQIVSLCVAAFAAALLAVQPEASISAVLGVAGGYGFGISLVVVIWLALQFIWLRVQQRHDITDTNADDAMTWYKTYFAKVRWGDITCGFVALVLTVSCFTVFKATAIGSNGYGFDALFISWDRAIFGGSDPWRLTHAIAPSAYATKFIDILYHPAFLPMVVGYTVCLAVQGKPELRYTYMVSYLASFVIIGMILAQALHSAGPVYDGILYGDGTDFASLIERLAEQDAAAGPFSAVFAQSYLLQLFQMNETGLGGGISAMPSMHIVLACLWTFAGWHLNRTLGVLTTFYAGLIWFGSVHLGWHYFVDGLVGLLCLAVIWGAAGHLFGLYGARQVIRATT